MSKLSLRQRAFNAGSWALTGVAVGQLLRLGGNLILTRLMFPEAFGLMAIMQTVMIGVTLLSDFGIQQGIIRHSRGHEADFLNTAWTIQVMQGLAIWLMLCLLAPVVAWFYKEPSITLMLPVVALNVLIMGFNPTKQVSLNRALALKYVTFIDVASQALGLVVTVLLAWMLRSVWALVLGGLVGAITRVWAGYALLEGPNNRFFWDKKAANELLKFGAWVMVSSSMTFLAGEGNKLVLGAFLGVKYLAFFTLASTMGSIFGQLAQKVSGKVLYPVYAEVFRERPQQIHSVLMRSRLLMISVGFAVALFFVFFGNALMGFLYDPRYAASGWMLQILAVGLLIDAVNGSYTGLLMAKGMMRSMTILTLVQVVIQLGGVVIGYYLAGEQGVILSIAAAYWVQYPFIAYAQARAGLWQPRVDLPFIALAMAIVAEMWWSGRLQHLMAGA